MPTLNVVLHGLFAIHERESDVILFLPEVENIHVFRAGAWLAETQLTRQTKYSLNGVVEGTAKFRDDENIVVPNKPLNPSAFDAAFASVTMPVPGEIFSLRGIALDPAVELAGADAPSVRTRVFPTVQVLTYDVLDFRGVELEGHDWVPSTDPAAVIQNLHILSEEEVSDREHSLLAFGKSAALLGVDLSLNAPKNVPLFDPRRDAPPAGVHPMELEDLVEREPRMNALGKAFRDVLPALDPSVPRGPLSLAEATELLDRLVRVWGTHVPAGSRFGGCSNLVTN